MVTHRVKKFSVPVYFLKEQYDNGLFVPKYEKSSVMTADMCTKPCLDPIIIQISKWMNGFVLNTTRDIEHYQLMIFYGFFVNKKNYRNYVV